MKTRIILLHIALSFILISCKKPIENPELKDPVYKDLMSSADMYKKEVEGLAKEIEGFQKEIESGDTNAGQKKLAKENIFNSKNRIFKVEQMEKYYRFSAESRKIYIRKQSLQAFREGKEWAPGTDSDYQARKAATEAPKKWLRGEKSRAPASKK